MLDVVDHRPWPLPEGPWAMVQTWRDLLFAHWPLPVEAVRRLIPPSLDVDTYDGQAWVGIVPFRMGGIRLRWLPAAPLLPGFPELNVRTYVRSGGKPGVYFFSLDAASWPAVAAARHWYHLPYFHARMSCVADRVTISYSSRRAHRGSQPAGLGARYGPIGDVFRSRPGSLEHWLTERYCLYAVDSRGTTYRGEIHHPPWPLQGGEGELWDNTMAQASGIRLPVIRPVLYFARRLDVAVWPIRPIG